MKQQGNVPSTVAGADTFLAKYNDSGGLQWTRQLGSNSKDGSQGVSADGMGNVYVSGWTNGGLGGDNAGSGRDVFVSKYDSAGTFQWTQQIGSSSNDPAHAVSADRLGSVFISGWTRGDFAGANTGDPDAFIIKYNASGAHQWTRQLGVSSYTDSNGVSADLLGNVYVTGSTRGNLGGSNAGSFDAALAKYDTSGTLQWIEQLGSNAPEYGNSASADSLGNIYVTGSTQGDLGGLNVGGVDSFLAKYDSSGTLQWTEQFGSSDYTLSQGVSADSLGNVYFSGATEGSLGGPNAGGEDAFLAKYGPDSNPVPEPTALIVWSILLGLSVNVIGRRCSLMM